MYGYINSIGYFTLVLRNFSPSPVLCDLPQVQISQVLSLCYAILTTLLGLSPSLFSFDTPPCYIPTAVKVAKIAPWIHHSQVKRASPEWECVPDPASPFQVTFWNACTLLQQDPASQETIGDHEQ
jgi:hypothetical protein